MTLNLLDYDAAGLADLLAAWGDKPFRAGQLLRWIHQRGERDFAQMSNIAKSLRARLQAEATIALPRVISDSATADLNREDRPKFQVNGCMILVSLFSAVSGAALRPHTRENPAVLAVVANAGQSGFEQRQARRKQHGLRTHGRRSAESGLRTICSILRTGPGCDRDPASVGGVLAVARAHRNPDRRPG